MYSHLQVHVVHHLLQVNVTLTRDHLVLTLNGIILVLGILIFYTQFNYQFIYLVVVFMINRNTGLLAICVGDVSCKVWNYRSPQQRTVATRMGGVV